MDEEELNEAIEALKRATQDYHKISEHNLYFDEHQYNHLMNLSYKLGNELKQEKEKNKKLEEQHKIDENSVIDLITQLNAENERCRNLSVELDEVNKIINLMAEDIANDDTIIGYLPNEREGVKEYYFNKAKDDKK